MICTINFTEKKKEYLLGLASIYTVFNLYQREYSPCTRFPLICVVEETFSLSNTVTDGKSVNVTDLTASSASRFPKYHLHW